MCKLRKILTTWIAKMVELRPYFMERLSMEALIVWTYTFLTQGT